MEFDAPDDGSDEYTDVESRRQDPPVAPVNKSKKRTLSLIDRIKNTRIHFDLPEEQRHGSTIYFDDGRRLIDYVLVYNLTIPSETREIFLETIVDMGLEIEEARSMIDPTLQFVKVHGPKYILQKYAERFDIPIKKLQTTYLRPPIPKFAFLRTELTSQDPSSPNFYRSETFSGDKPRRFLSCERGLIVFNILKRIEYGSNIFDNGIERLIDNVHFCAAFPLHDGTYKWEDHPTNPLNDRQILFKYWSHTNMIFKSQPVDVIGKYFGYNTALYFAWLSFYNKMLILPVLMGVIVYVINISYYFYNNVYSITIEEICKSELIICPACPTCPSLPLKSYCANYQLNYMSDTIFTVAFATVISFWAAVYMGLWKRKQAVYVLRWNLQDSEFEEQDIRPEFENFATNVKMSEFGEPDIYIPWYIVLYRRVFTAFIIFLIMGVVVSVIAAIIIIQIVMTHTTINNVVATIISSLLTVISILVMRRVCIGIYNRIVLWMVNFEVPKTQTEFDNSYIRKLFVFSFVNNYGSLIYLAFLKGRYYTHPNDPNMYAESAYYLTDTCDPSGCFSEVHMQLAILMFLLPGLTNLIRYIRSRIIIWIRKNKLSKLQILFNIPRWEKDYGLEPLTNEELLMMYEEMVIQFGFLTLFTFAFPFAPLIAWVNSLIKTQIDAKYLVTECRRPNPKRTANIGAWMDIMTLLTYLSVFFNALYITFTSSFLHKLIYKLFEEDSLEGYVEHSLSTYYINLDHWPFAGVPNGTECLYPGYRNAPDSDHPFEPKYEYYQLLAIKFAFIIIFEHTILGVTALISYSLPEIPQDVKQITGLRTMKLRKLLEKEASFTTESIIRVNQPQINVDRLRRSSLRK